MSVSLATRALCTGRAGDGDLPTLSERIRDMTIAYGDPPNIGCCPAGPTMNSVPRRVLEYWYGIPGALQGLCDPR